MVQLFADYIKAFTGIHSPADQKKAPGGYKLPVSEFGEMGTSF